MYEKLVIQDLLNIGEEKGLITIRDDTIEYPLINRRYAKTKEELVRAALYVSLIIGNNVDPTHIILERDQIDLAVKNDKGSVKNVYECKPECSSDREFYEAAIQVRTYAVRSNAQKAYIAFNSNGKLVVKEVVIKPKVQIPQASSPQKSSPIVVSTINLKGGVGKTSLTCALAEFLCLNHKKKVLVIDLDPQTNATVVLMGEDKWKEERDDRGLTLAHFFEDRVKRPRDAPSINPKDILVENVSNIGNGIVGLDLLPSSPHFIEFLEEIPSIPARRFGAGSYVTVLKDCLDPIITEKAYDYILIDCPPSLAALTQNGLYISHYYLIPCVPDWLSTYGIPLILRHAWEFSKLHNKTLNCLGIVFCRYRSQVSLHRRTVERYKRLQGQKVSGEPDSPTYPRVFQTIIPETVKAEAAVEPGRRLNTLKQKYGYGNPPLYESYENFTIEFIEVVEEYEKSKQIK